MRTSRVHPVANSTYRNSRQYLQSNEQVFRLMQDGGGNPFHKQSRQQKKRNNHSEQQNKGTKVILNRNSKRLMIKGEPLDVEAIENMQNSLLHHAMKINSERNKKVRIRTYRNSI